ncbi:KilA-N domain protein [Methanobrevibacter curvatus]|uniref:KilA-N domain protein n=1 Tax=Methanobrevibacter curvatus TaxID=49547 RepID=A0A165ZHW8_9EURY|nr:KilA-N domain protein [Methanobrevibacter curvatus]
MSKKETINVKGTNVSLISKAKEEYFSLTDIAKYRNDKNPSEIISLWLRTFSTIEYLGLWEKLNNPNFKPHIYEGFKVESAKPHFWMSPKKWISETNAIGMISKSGRYGGGTFAHSDIAFKFAAWISAEFELYLIKEFKRLKTEEQKHLSSEWNLQRTLSKINYRIHTDAIKETIIPKILTNEQISYVYANEADLLNVALFGMTAKQWREANPDKKGNIRDHATIEQLIVLSNMEGINALLVREEIHQSERVAQLNKVAITQMQSLINDSNITKKIEINFI